MHIPRTGRWPLFAGALTLLLSACVFPPPSGAELPDVPICGDGVVEGDEECEPGSDSCPDGQICQPSTCECGFLEFAGVIVEESPPLSEPMCGNDVVDPGEECDGGVEGSNRDACGISADCDRGGCDVGFYCGDDCTCSRTRYSGSIACGAGIGWIENECQPYPTICETGDDPEVDCSLRSCFWEGVEGTECHPETCLCVPPEEMPQPSALPICGNNVVEGAEECDGGVPMDRCWEAVYCNRGGCLTGFYCGDDCRCQPSERLVCGDGVLHDLEEGEECEPEVCDDEGNCEANVGCEGGAVCNPSTCECQTVAPAAPEPGDASSSGPLPSFTCGDGVCQFAVGETCDTCMVDCGPCVPTSGEGACPVGPGQCCGDGVCQSDESPDWCGDCVASPGGDGGGAEGSDGSLCGDGVCQSDESPDWCGDCVSGGDGGDGGDGGGDGGGQPPVCGNGVLEKGEGCENDSHCASDQYCASNCTCDTFI